MPSASESSADSDQDFDPTAEMLVNDFDDEHTLEEEEAMESADSFTNELDDLQREGEMPLSEVLAMYGYGSRAEYEEAVQKVDSPPKESTEQSPQPSPANQEAPKIAEAPTIIEESKSEEPPDDVIIIIPEISTGTTRPLLRSVHQASESSDTGTDDDYSPDDDWRKTIQVGSDYQAVIPEGLSQYDDAPAYENEDRLLWDPSKLSDVEVEDYLRQCQQSHTGNQSGVNSVPTGNHIRDDEQALFLLLQCGHNKEEALRRRRMQPLHPADTMSLWSEDECRSFETGLKTYGKDFHLIQLNKVRTRAVGELVQFYYIWKKSERHDLFASKNRIEKKKYSLHPGTTDYMDRFLDEQENPPCYRDRSSSPNLLGDSKKRMPLGNLSSEMCIPDGASSSLLERVRSPGKIQSGNPPSDCNKEYMNGEDRLLPSCLNSDHLSEPTNCLPPNPPNDRFDSGKEVH